MGFGLFPQYDYLFPRELVANTPAEPRDSARLMVVDTAKEQIAFGVFRDLAKHLSTDDLLVLNDTKVVPARLRARKGDEDFEILFLFNEYVRGDVTIPGIVSKNLFIGDVVLLDGGRSVTVVSQDENVFHFALDVSYAEFLSVVETYGETPVPKYIHDIPLSEKELRVRYQTIFAGAPASCAAPTASLHFTEEVFHSLERTGVDRTFVTLHVGLGTFMPVTPENIASGTLHTEPFSISSQSAEKIAKHMKTGSIVAAGTTVVRTLETAARELGRGHGVAMETDLFIRPPYDFKIVDKLITNFHVPQSSLMCLTDAFLQYKRSPWTITELYQKAIDERMQLFSFGDAMLII